MLREIKKYFFQQPEKAYSEWCFPKYKNTMVNGLIFTFITITALSLVDYFYYSESYYNSLKPTQAKPFGIDSIFRLILLPIVNVGLIFLARSQWNKDINRLEKIGSLIVLGSLFAFLGTSFSHEYYTADDFTFDALVLIIFTQTLLGLNFRTSSFLNLLLVAIAITYVWIDDIELKIQMYNTTLLLLLWLPVLIGTFRLEQAKALNYQTIFKLKVSNTELAQTHEKVEEQKKLLRAGEKVSKLASWKTLGSFDTIHYSDGVYDIYELEKSIAPTSKLYTKTLRLVHPDDLEKVALHIGQLNNGQLNNKSLVKKIIPLEYRILLPDNRIKWLRYTIGEYRIGKEIVGTVQDITSSKILALELQETLDQLKIKNEDLQQFAYASSHDLQEPLRSITNFGNLFNRSMGDQLNSDQRMFLDIILNSTTRMSNLISAILDYSRIGRSKQKTQINCEEVAQDVLTDLNYALQEANGTVHIRSLPNIIGFPVEFRTLLQNLIGNALKFRHKDRPPIVHVSCQTTKAYYKFSVKDNGIGIEEKYMHKIFQLFSRLHAKEAYEGTGIGLTHCKKIAELHGGRIWVESQQSEGTSFYFTISTTLKAKKNEKEITLHHAH